MTNYTSRTTNTDVQAIGTLSGLISTEVAPGLAAIQTQPVWLTRVDIGSLFPDEFECCHAEDAAHLVDVQSRDAREITIPRRQVAVRRVAQRRCEG